MSQAGRPGAPPLDPAGGSAPRPASTWPESPADTGAPSGCGSGGAAPSGGSGAKPLTSLLDTLEGRRLRGEDEPAWRRWGPYPSDRQWGTVREDYSPGGTAWEYFPHDHARSRAYRWGEDAIAGFSDDACYLNLGLALWNGADPIIKERLFGLSNSEGNHGEDVKELYFYLDSVPSHAYQRMLYKYPQREFPYDDLVAENARRGTDVGEYEILDTGIFEGERSFDITVEYAKATPDDIRMRITARNRADQPATLHLLPQLTARNIWSWTNDAPRPRLERTADHVAITHPCLPAMRLEADQAVDWLFCENDTNTPRLFGEDAPGPFKDGINDYLIHNAPDTIRRDHGTKCAALLRAELAPGATITLTLRLCPDDALADSDHAAIFTARRAEADAFYAVLQEGITDSDARLVQRQALAGLLWSKQFYCYDVYRWLRGDPAQPRPPDERWNGRNATWQHLSNAHIVSMPDKWEYPWYASWDLAFQSVTFALIDPAFAKSQLMLLLRDRYMHPSGQKPAYEWAFDDSNPPVHAWATWRVFEMDRALTGTPDRGFLREVFNKLLLNFGWWVNRKDGTGRNIFEGGFLGLDNIEIFNRSQPLPTGGTLDQADGTGWMAGFALNMLRIALELAMDDEHYQDIAVKFVEHFLYISKALGDAAFGRGLWDEQDQFFYDRLCLPNGTSTPLRVRSAVGLIPMLAVQVIEPELIANLPQLRDSITWFFDHRPDLASLVSDVDEPGRGDRRLLSLLRTHRLTKLLERMLDETEFLSDYGIRAVSKIHEANPYIYRVNGTEYRLKYEPAESINRDFGGNSNWRGPIWMPINYRIVEALFEHARYYGDSFRVAYPPGTDNTISLAETAALISQRLVALFTKGKSGRRPVMATYPQLSGKAEPEDLILFHEYFDGDTGRGVGASHQTGWTACIALLLQPRKECQASNIPMAGGGGK
jgi:hypothetical protein